MSTSSEQDPDDSLEPAASPATGATPIQPPRAAMVQRLWKLNALRSERVAEVFATVDRHVFAPSVPAEEVYDATTAVRTKWDEHGSAISSISAPQIQAFMLEQADVRPGMRVLEVGSGGVNAAMLAELVGDTGTVTTMDIDPEITGRARKLLDAAGYPQVHVECADAEHGVPARAPFDVALVTVGCWDLPAALMDQLAESGRVVVPLRMRGITRSLSLRRAGDHLLADSAEVCGFVKAQGLGAHQERMLLLHGDRIALRFDDGTAPADSARLDGALGTDRVDVWSGITVEAMEPFDSLGLWLASVLPGSCRIAVDPDYDPDTDSGPAMVVPEGRWFPDAYVNSHEDSFAYLATRRLDDGLFEFGAHAFGPHAGEAAEAMVEQIRAWDRDYRHGPDPSVAVWPYDAPDEALESPDAAATTVIPKRHTTITISWPHPSA
uniref:methyltransferase, FxLD system n=1 Tax=Saccharopolyspora galaxeae TaxID=2781241 RepID=UPI0027DE4A12|nr:methyltransferase, FxLD system [Saccharopolyspora sp. HNM0986]